MFEKEAEEYAMRKDVITENDRVPFDNGYGFQTVSFEDEVKKAFKDGAEYGYNKANEWHYVKDGDLPKEEGDYLFYLYDKETKYTFYEVLGIARTYADRDDLYIESMIWTLEDVIAWKEIVLPEENK